MDAKQFLAEFGHIVNATGGVQKLRELVYNLAVSGNLCQRDENEGEASELLEAITIEKNKRVKEKSFKRTPKFEKLGIILPNGFELPQNWVWTNLVSIGEISPKNTADDDLECSFVPMSGVSQEYDGDLVVETRKWGKIKKGYTQLANGDVAIAKITPCFENGKSAVIEGLKNCIGAGTTELHVVRPLPGVNPKYIYIFLRSPYFRVEGELKMTGTAGQKRLSSDYFATRAFPLPPIEEQDRIVEKVDELMSLCDKLEEQQQKKRQVQNQLRQTSLRALAEASSPFELKQHWQRVRVNFSSLFSSAKDTVDFSDHIKELAVKGLLCRSDFNVADIEQARGQRTELLNCYLEKKLMRKQKSVSVAESDVEYPTNWQVVAFDEIALVTGGVTKGRKLKDREFISCPYLAVANVQRGFFNLTNLKTIDIPVDEIEKYAVQPGDLLITEGGDWDKVGRTAIWRSNIENCLHQNHVFKVRVPSGEVLNEWVELVFNSMVGRSYFAGASKQTTNLASINMTQLRSFPFPVPPLSQQIEIINIVGTLNKLCSVWKEKYERLNDLSSLFVKEAIANFTGVNTVKKEKPLKVPKTELVSPITLGLNKPSGKDDAPLATLLARQSGKMNANDLWQRFGGEIDAFYAQLKVEVAHGWIAEPETANMLEKDEK